ncbi:MAG TPA: DUF4166 domain-containing protein [Steroidobacteraceae bacterium]|nr:DUF4166 domain-containing protein [Steroidobacteraceae bacterium]
MNASRRGTVALTVANAVQDVNCVPSPDFNPIEAIPRAATFRLARDVGHPSVRRVLGEVAWKRLPTLVRARFADDVIEARYEGAFDVVRANLPGRCLALLCRLIKTPIAPGMGLNVPATVKVYANAARGMVWERTYRFPAETCVVSSIKQLDAAGQFVEALPAGLRMPLDVFEREGVLHFVSRGYFFDWVGVHLPVPDALPPGVTHVEHRDEGDGWFRFTMTVTHKWFGEVYFQTGRFRDAEFVRRTVTGHAKS